MNWLLRSWRGPESQSGLAPTVTLLPTGPAELCADVGKGLLARWLTRPRQLPRLQEVAKEEAKGETVVGHLPMATTAF